MTQPLQSTFQYPTVTSRTLNPNGKSLVTVVAMHDRQITDADINLIQDLQTSKLQSLVEDSGVTSGGVTYTPFTFNTTSLSAAVTATSVASNVLTVTASNSFSAGQQVVISGTAEAFLNGQTFTVTGATATNFTANFTHANYTNNSDTGTASSPPPLAFFIPQFDVLFSGEIVTIAGQQSTDITTNMVAVPSPPIQPSAANIAAGDEDARLYIVFLELWYQALNPITGKGYYPVGGPTPFYFYPYGGILPAPSNATLIPDDSIDPFQGLLTTERAVIQWRLNVQRVSLDYDFTRGQWGFFYTNARTPGTIGPLDPGQIVYGQASLPTVTPGVSPLVGVSTYQFTSMGAVNGDTGLWRCGDGNVNNSLGTMDGYSYAMPVAAVFQRNTSNFNVSTNVYGCANQSVAGSGTLATKISGRFDERLADQVLPGDVVDTRSTVSLTGWDMDDIMRKGFVDLVMGNQQAAVSRFTDPSGNKSEQVGSLLDYYLAMGPSTSPIVTRVGTWDGFANGFSSDQRTFFTSVKINPNISGAGGKATGTAGLPWTINDSFAIALPQGSAATITQCEVSALVSDPTNSFKTPAALLQGQVNITGLNSTTVTVTFIKNLANTLFNPGLNNLYATIGVTYPAGGASLKKVPKVLAGGTLFDNVTGKTMPVYGVSEYAVQANQAALTAQSVFSLNPEFSDLQFGTRVVLAIPGSQGNVTTQNSVSQTTFVINMQGLNSGTINGLYTVSAEDSVTLVPYNVASRLMTSTSNGIQHIVTLTGAVAPSSTVLFTIIAQNTAQLAYNAPVQGATETEETVLFGQAVSDTNFPLDPRVVVESVYYNPTSDVNTIVFGANGCVIKGISGDDSIRLIWTKDGSGNLVSQPITSAVFGNGTLTVTVPGNGGTNIFTYRTTPFLLVGSILPAFDPLSVMTLEVQYVPYQGEGVMNRDYDILHSEDNALVTTNGTGAAPQIGITDVFPYNREFPIAACLPAQPSWPDTGLTNAPVATFFDSNYVAMQQDNVEHTFLAPLHTNDFVPPINKDIRKAVRFVATGQRGYAQAIPHLGFAIAPPTPRTVLGQNLQSTQAPITLYVDNVNGLDTNTGLSLTNAKLTILSALSELPPVLRHPCTIILKNTGVVFSISALQSNLEVIALGDGDIRALKQYALGNLSRVIQDEGRLVISNQPGAPPSVIDATGFSGFGDGPTSAFYIENSRVILNGIQFQGFTNPAITAYSSDIDMVGCVWQANVQAGSYIGCNVVIFDGGSTSMPPSGTGHVFAQCNVTSSNHNLVLPGGPAQSAFYAGTRNTTIFLQQHSTNSLSETNIATTTVVATAQLNSSIDCNATFQTAGSAVLSANSVLLRTVAVDPFIGGVVADSSSSVVTQV